MTQHEDEIFKRGSKTYYAAAALFPKDTREDVAKLYSFVRVADDYIDSIPQQPDKFYALTSAWSGRDRTVRVVRNMDDVAIKYQFDDEWIAAFLTSMEMDLKPRTMQNRMELQQYIYGSAEVIGLMMSRILGLPHAAETAARAQGSAMQLINFIRDINEDISLGRQYLPLDDMEHANLSALNKETAVKEYDEFKQFINVQLDRYQEFQAVADSGMKYIPRQYRRAILVANDGYGWTARAIRRRPMRVFERSAKPPKWYLLWRSLVRWVST